MASLDLSKTFTIIALMKSSVSKIDPFKFTTSSITLLQRRFRLASPTFYANDTAFYCSHKNLIIQNHLILLGKYFKRWIFQINTLKSQVIFQRNTKIIYCHYFEISSHTVFSPSESAKQQIQIRISILYHFSSMEYIFDHLNLLNQRF